MLPFYDPRQVLQFTVSWQNQLLICSEWSCPEILSWRTGLGNSQKIPTYSNVSLKLKISKYIPLKIELWKLFLIWYYWIMHDLYGYLLFCCFEYYVAKYSSCQVFHVKIVFEKKICNISCFACDTFLTFVLDLITVAIVKGTSIAFASNPMKMSL